MKNPFLGLFRARDKPRDEVSAAPTFYFGSSTSDKTVNPKNAVQASTVYACVRVIAETIASLPAGVYEATEHGSQKAPDSGIRQTALEDASLQQLPVKLMRLFPNHHGSDRSSSHSNFV